MAKALVRLKKRVNCPICRRVLNEVEPIPTIEGSGLRFRCPYCRCILPVGCGDVVGLERFSN